VKEAFTLAVTVGDYYADESTGNQNLSIAERFYSTAFNWNDDS